MKKISSWFRSRPPEDRAGIYMTVIIHLIAVITLLVAQTGSLISGEGEFLLDFSQTEEAPKIEQPLSFEEEISRRIDQMLESMANIPAPSTSQVRNIAVDASSGPLKDDRGTDAEELYREAQRLAEDLRTPISAIEEDARDETVDINPDRTRSDDKPAKEYKGPSVLSYSLDGRKASRLPIPAYRCMGGGEVTVLIEVDAQGNVTKAQIYDEISSSDKCLRDFARRAALLSKFNKISPDRLKANPGLARQRGEIVYKFIQQ